MNKTSSNIYKNARLKAELKREPVAEELHIDVRTLDKYESLDGRIPPDEIVRKMCELYNNKYLAYLHIKQSPLGEFLPDLEPTTFEGATLTMVSSLNAVNGTVNQIIKIASGAGSNYKVVGKIKRGTKVTVTATSGSWSKIGKNKWVSTAYLSASKVKTSTTTTKKKAVKYKTTVGKSYRLKSAATLYSKGNLTGTKYSYKANTQIKVVNHYSASVDRVYVVKTERYAYVPVSKFS